MSLDDFSNVQVSADGPALTEIGFGTLGLASYHSHFPERSQDVTSLDDLTELGFRTTEPGYRMAQVAFAQKPKLARVKMLRLANAPAVSFRLTPAVLDSAKYEIDFEYDSDGDADDLVPFGVHKISYTSDGSASADEICDGFQAAIDAVFFPEVGESTTSLAVGTGAKTFTVSPAPDAEVFPVGAAFLAESATDGDTMSGTVTSYDPDTGELVTDVTAVSGSGTNADWTLSVRYLVVTPSGGTATYLDVTTVPGRTFYMSAYRHDRFTIQDRTADPGIAADLAAIRLEEPDFYGFAVSQNSAAILEKAADWAETQLVILGGNNSDSRNFDSEDDTDIASVLGSKSYVRCVIMHDHDQTGAYGGVAMLGERLPFDPGAPPNAGGTLHAKTLRGVTADSLTPSQKADLRAKRFVVYVSTSGRAHTLDGFSPSGEFIDYTRFVDWYTIRQQEKLAAMQLNNGRVPYNNTGRAMIESCMRAQLTEGRRSGGVDDVDADGNPPAIEIPTIAQQTSNDRRARIFRNCLASWKYAGAIHRVDPVKINVTF